MEILEPVNAKVHVTVRGLRKDASILGENNVFAEIDLSAARLGNTIFPITRDHIRLPNNGVYVIHIDPPQIEFKFKEKTPSK